MKSSEHGCKTITWWGRSDASYARNGVMRSAMASLGIQIFDFSPRLSKAGHIEASLRSIPVPDAVWVPCFRQRDLASASKWAHKKDIPLLFDPLISAYDKQVFERGKFSKDSSQARRLLLWEQQLFQLADMVIADTALHAEYFEDTLGVQHQRIHVIPVGAEEDVFFPAEGTPKDRKRVLYYGNYLELHGVETIADVVCMEAAAEIDWVFIGDGPTREIVQRRCSSLPHAQFIDWIQYRELPSEIHAADLLLGVFGATNKAKRVIPNKVYQSLASGRPVVTMKSMAYPAELLATMNSGLYWVKPADSEDLFRVIHSALNNDFANDCLEARKTYDRFFSSSMIKEKLSSLMRQL